MSRHGMPRRAAQTRVIGEGRRAIKGRTTSLAGGTSSQSIAPSSGSLVGRGTTAGVGAAQAGLGELG